LVHVGELPGWCDLCENVEGMAHRLSPSSRMDFPASLGGCLPELIPKRVLHCLHRPHFWLRPRVGVGLVFVHCMAILTDVLKSGKRGRQKVLLCPCPTKGTPLLSPRLSAGVLRGGLIN
jgi:hypothetical protein